MSDVNVVNEFFFILYFWFPLVLKMGKSPSNNTEKNGHRKIIGQIIEWCVYVFFFSLSQVILIEKHFIVLELVQNGINRNDQAF